jgi:hypothetical protein
MTFFDDNNDEPGIPEGNQPIRGEGQDEPILGESGEIIQEE